jgi:single-stranded-DNA-specific exonuclease
LSRTRWKLLPPAPIEHINGMAGFPPLVVQLLYNRGLAEESQIEMFLSADGRLSSDPFLMPDIHQAISRIYRALLCGEKVAVYGDFDADGITGTAVLVKGLCALGGTVVPYIPNRITEGHGLRTEALEKLHGQGVSLVVTVDCGITDIAEVEQAKGMGMEVIVTDHHTPLDNLPPAVALVNPKLAGSRYPFIELAGVGVAYKLVQALFQSMGRNGQSQELVDLVMLGTIADMSPLLGENRYLVKCGLDIINSGPRLGLKELIARAGLSGAINEDCITWSLAPRLNAAGRLDDAAAGYRLLMTDSPSEANELASALEQTNAERQRLTASVLDKAREEVLKAGISPLLMVCDQEYFIGIAGLVAGRLAEEFYRPSIVVESGEATSNGSCRSIPEFNLIAALNQCSDLFIRYGGHSQAAGFTLPTANLYRLQERLSEIAAARLQGLDLRPHITVDAEVRLPYLAGNTFNAMQKLAPFGQGNPVPTLVSRGVDVVDCRTMGNGGEHLRLKLKQGGTVWDAVAFRQGDCLEDVSPCLDIVFNLEVDNWGGMERLRLNLLDFDSTRPKKAATP